MWSQGTRENEATPPLTTLEDALANIPQHPKPCHGNKPSKPSMALGHSEIESSRKKEDPSLGVGLSEYGAIGLSEQRYRHHWPGD